MYWISSSIGITSLLSNLFTASKKYSCAEWFCFYIKGMKFSEFLKKWAVSVILLPVCIYIVVNRGHYGLIDNADLVIHEAGHAFFYFFGRFIYTAGGTLMQIILPSLIAWYFFRNSYKTGVQFSLLWLGQNLINISVYAADARARRLPLLGGNHVYHDWHYMLSHLNLLNYDAEVGYLFVGLAVVTFIVSLLMPVIIRE